MKLENYRAIIVTLGLIITILIALPSIEMVLNFPGGEPFSELYVLGLTHQAGDYPYNIVSNKNYTVYVDVSNSLGSMAYYKLYAKFGNQNDQLPNATSGEPSPLPPIFESQFIVQNGKTWETKLTFSASNVFISANQTQIRTLTINNITNNVNKTSTWDSNTQSTDYNLIFELWLYNSTASEFQYNNCATWFKITLTQPT
jgi:hypothetical protein